MLSAYPQKAGYAVSAPDLLGIRVLNVGNSFSKHFRDKRSGVSSAVRSLVDIFKRNKVFTPALEKRFVFLCGAGGRDGLSPRRRALSEFAAANLQNCIFFQAERIVDVLLKEGKEKNLLDVENDVLAVSDFILIVLESESAFCELGAFASIGSVREKIIVINNRLYRDSQSFINYGPLKAIKEVREAHILDYYMSPIEYESVDSVAEIYLPLSKLLLAEQTEKRRKKVVLEDCSPESLSKQSMQLVSDLIWFCGPITAVELIEILKFLFGPRNFKMIQVILGTLTACRDIVVAPGERPMYWSKRATPMFDYLNFDEIDVRSAFRHHYLKFSSNRFTLDV